MRPLHQFFQRFFLPFGKDLDAPIGEIFHPTDHPEAVRFMLCRRAKIDVLHTSMNNEVYLFSFHRFVVSSGHHVEARADVQFRAKRSAHAR